MAKNVQTFTPRNFEQEVLKSDVPVLVDFFATWCGPCKILAPRVAEVADLTEGRLKVGKFDVEQDGKLASGKTVTGAYKVSSMPTLLVFMKGKVVGSSIGLCSTRAVAKLVKEAKVKITLAGLDDVED